MRNASQASLGVSLGAEFGSGAGRASSKLPAQDVVLAAGEAREFGWDVLVPNDVERLEWRIDATARAEASGEPVRDALKVSQRVIPAVPARTFQATLVQLDRPLDIAVQLPADALPGRGGLNVQMQGRLSGELPGVRDYLERYPFTCFAQQASIAIGLRDAAMDALMRALPQYLDREDWSSTSR